MIDGAWQSLDSKVEICPFRPRSIGPNGRYINRRPSAVLLLWRPIALGSGSFSVYDAPKKQFSLPGALPVYSPTYMSGRRGDPEVRAKISRKSVHSLKSALAEERA